MQTLSIGKAYLEALVRLFYPAECALCNSLLSLSEQAICQGCRSTVAIKRYSLSEASISQKWDYVDQAWALYPYEGAIKDLLTLIKFERKAYLLKIFQSQIQALSNALNPEFRYNVIIPIPISRMGLLKREFNQTEMLAQYWQRDRGISIKHGLRKKINTHLQSSLGREERQWNIFGAFEVRTSFQGQNILLVDDILTTGATADEAARILKQAGAKRVDLFCLARTLIS